MAVEVAGLGLWLPSVRLNRGLISARLNSSFLFCELIRHFNATLL